MKHLFILFCIFVTINCFAQISTRDIKKYKISKVIETSSFFNGAQTAVTETSYNVSYFDSAISVNGKMNNIIYSFDQMNRPAGKYIYNSQGAEIGNVVYNYKPDGSYEITYNYLTDENTAIEWFDKQGRMEKMQLKDGSKRFYDYDEKNKLTGVMTMLSPKGKGEIVDLKYTYNNRGQMLKEINNGINKWEKTFTYDAKGLVISIDQVSKTGDGKYTGKTSISYEFRK